MKNYPNGIRQAAKPRVKLPPVFANRGMEFEEEIEGTNLYYRETKAGSIHKRPTPIKIVRMREGRITDGFFQKKSTVDYEGISKGVHLEYDCKECNIETRFPLDYIESHQIEHLLEVQAEGGIGFFLIKFLHPEERVFLVTIDQIVGWQGADRKSIPRQWFNEVAIPVKRSGINRWDYLPHVHRLARIKLENEKRGAI